MNELYDFNKSDIFKNILLANVKNVKMALKLALKCNVPSEFDMLKRKQSNNLRIIHCKTKSVLIKHRACSWMFNENFLFRRTLELYKMKKLCQEE